jgi:hypothetical protein
MSRPFDVWELESVCRTARVDLDDMKVRGVKFLESPLLPPTGAYIIVGRDPYSLSPVQFIGPPGFMQPERIGATVNWLREHGYPVEVESAPAEGGRS